MAKERRLHPTLKKLGYPGVTKSVSPLDLLNRLLKNDLISSSSVEEAFQTCLTEVQSMNDPSKREQKRSSNKEKGRVQQRHTRHVALRFYYDGAEYSGLAQNMGMESDKSVEKALFAALIKTRMVESRDSCGFSRCGRTDRGVSSAGQVVALRIKSNFPLDASHDEEGQSLLQETELPNNSLHKVHTWISAKEGDGPRVKAELSEYPYDKILNNVLPPTIRVMGWSPVSNDFSARFSATTRTYRYFFVKRDMDLDRMQEALQLLKGTHDFRNFCKMDVEKVYNFERTIHATKLVIDSEKEGVCYFEILGQAFLWHQIRCIVSILFMVGRRQEEVSVVKELLDVQRHPGKPSYPLASEYPLVLHHCGYPSLQMGHSCHNLWAVSCHFEEQWEDLLLAAARVRNGVCSMDDCAVRRQDVLDFARLRLTERFKKRRKHNPTPVTLEEHLQNLENGLGASPLLSWRTALDWLEQKGLRPSPQGMREIGHIPLLQRSKGPTYEEKIDALSKSRKRLERYEENVIKKRKTKEEDKAFYDHMARQGGSGV